MAKLRKSRKRPAAPQRPRAARAKPWPPQGENASRKRRTAAEEAAIEKPKAFPIVGIGASAGGLEAFTKLLGGLPADTGMAFVLVQHLDPRRESMLVEILARSTSMPVQEVRGGMRVEPDHVYVIPANAEIGLIDGSFKAGPRAPERGRELMVDHFFRSLAENYRRLAIGVV
ncbi:MAG TPA: chemotaxis protein CheB, partial [Thermoanaerobaculia bacterium]|nr:chemotaxis protein CheB [Thermoanaerobaculia bacterium]